jgi:hypothetical protein
VIHDVIRSRHLSVAAFVALALPLAAVSATPSRGGLPSTGAAKPLAAVTAIPSRGRQPAPAGAARVCTKFAAPHGADSARGTRRHPFRTAQRLVKALRHGQVGCLRSGTYSSERSFVLDFSRSGLTVISYPGERAVLRGIVVVRRGANSVRLANVTVDGDGSQNTIQVYAADFTLSRSDVTNERRGRSCLMLGDPAAGTALRPVIRGNRFHECGNPANGNKDHGIYANNVTDGLITENVFWNSAAYTIQLYPHAQHTVFSRNVVDGGGNAARGGVVIGGTTSGIPSSGNTVEHNVITYAATYNIESWWGGAEGTGNLARSNCLFGGGAGEIRQPAGLTIGGNVVSDPQFVDRAHHDFRLRASSGCRKVVRYSGAMLRSGRNRSG